MDAVPVMPNASPVFSMVTAASVPPSICMGLCCWNSPSTSLTEAPCTVIVAGTPTMPSRGSKPLPPGIETIMFGRVSTRLRRRR